MERRDLEERVEVQGRAEMEQEDASRIRQNRETRVELAKMLTRAGFEALSL